MWEQLPRGKDSKNGNLVKIEQNKVFHKGKKKF